MTVQRRADTAESGEELSRGARLRLRRDDAKKSWSGNLDLPTGRRRRKEKSQKKSSARFDCVWELHATSRRSKASSHQFWPARMRRLGIVGDLFCDPESRHALVDLHENREGLEAQRIARERARAERERKPSEALPGKGLLAAALFALYTSPTGDDNVENASTTERPNCVESSTTTWGAAPSSWPGRTPRLGTARR